MRLLEDLKLSRASAAAFAVVGVYWGTFAALVPEVKEQVGLNDGAFGLALFIAALGAVLAMWLAPLADRLLGRRALVILSLALATAFLLPGLSWNFSSFAAAMAMATMASGTLDVVMNARISAVESREGRSLMNLNHATFSFAYAGSAILTGLWRELSFSPALIFLIAGALTLGLTLLMRQRREPDIQDATVTDTRLPVSAAVLVPGGLIILVAFMSEQATEGWSALHLERGLGAGAAGGALGPAILGLTMAIGRLSGQLVANRYSEASVIRIGATVAAIGSFVAAAATTIPMAYLGFGLLGLGVSIVAPMAYAWIGRIVPDSQRTLAISRISVIGYTGFFLGPPLMGFLSEAMSLSASFTAIGVLLVLIPLAFVPYLGRRTDGR